MFGACSAPTDLDESPALLITDNQRGRKILLTLAVGCWGRRGLGAKKMGQVIAKFLCRHCGGSSLKSAGRLSERSVVTCKSCGTPIGLWDKLLRLKLVLDQDQVEHAPAPS
jgi:hypothetical protein